MQLEQANHRAREGEEGGEFIDETIDDGIVHISRSQ